MGLTLACQILPLYWVKPKGQVELIGVGKFLFGDGGKLLRTSSISPSLTVEGAREGIST